ncbi:flavodoxin [bacterium]|nr:flavodoxin [bacterium]
MADKVLVVYYSCQGSTRRAAEALKELMGADLREIVPVKKYNVASAYTLGIVQCMSKAEPELAEKIDVSGYDVVYVGTPVWAFTMSPPVRSFLKNSDLKGKKVIPFCTNRGQQGSSLKDMAALCEGAEVREGAELKFVAKLSDEELKAAVKEKFQLN